jgi:twitching motility two-component system response regulator PilH
MVQSQMSGGATKNTILVVDDSTTMRSMVQSFLPQDEFHVQVAKSGQEGLARIHEHCPDILLLDFIMPGMNGYEVYIQLREQPEYADLPIVIMSGSKVEVFNKFAESKAEQKFVFLSKPFDPETLKKQIALALELQFISTTVEDTAHQEEIPCEKPANELVPAGEAVAVAESEPQPIVSLEPEVVVPTDETTLEEEFALHLSHAPVEMPEMSTAQVPQIFLEETSIHELPMEAAQTEHFAETVGSAASGEPIEVPMAQVPIEEMSFVPTPAPILETAHLSEEAYSLPSDESHEIPLAQVPLKVPTQETSLNISHALPLDVAAPISEDKTVHATPSDEPVEVPIAQMPIEEVSLAPIYVSTTEIVHLSNTLHSSTAEAPEIDTFQVSFDEVNIHEMSMDTASLNETIDSLSHEPEMPPAGGSPEEASIDELQELPIETPVDAQTREEASEISFVPVSVEAMSLDYIQQNLAHIIQTETYVMAVLQSLDERVAKDMHSIKNLADQTALLQQEFSHVRGVLNNLNDLPKHFEALKEQVLTQPQVHPDESGQEHLLMVGTRLNHVDSTLMQSIVTLDRLEEIQAGIGESLSNSYGQLSDRLTAIERRFEAIVVRSPEPDPVPATPAAKSPMPPLLYIIIALGALNFGAMVALLLR